MFSLLKRLVIAVEKIAEHTMSRTEYLYFHGELLEIQKIKSLECMNMQIVHAQKELLYKAEYKISKGIDLSVDEQMAIDRCNREQEVPDINNNIDSKISKLLQKIYLKKANGQELTVAEKKAISNYENEKQIKQNI